MKTLQNMMSRRFYMLLLAVTLTMLTATSAEALIYSQNLEFETTDQSIWDSGSASTLNANSFIGFTWGPLAYSIGEIIGDECFEVLGVQICNPIPKTGAELSASTEGEIGIDVGFQMDSGSVNVFFPVTVELIYPEQVKYGETFTISSQYSIGTEAFFTTNFPELQIYADLIFQMYAAIGGEGCVAGFCTTFGIGDFDVDETYEIFAFNRDDDGELRILGDSPLGDFQFGEPYSLGDYGDVTLSIPDINTTSGALSGDTLSSSGSDDVLSLGIDIDQIATTAIGLPIALEGEVGPLSYNLLDISFGPDFDIEQAFSFNPDLTVSLRLSTGEIFTFPLGGSIDIVMPTYDLDLAPTFSLFNTFENDTDLGIGLEGSIEVVSASAFDISIGPLYEDSWTSGSLLSLNLFDNSFPLLGFADFTTESFRIKMVPEPGTLILLGTGVIAVVVMGRKRLLTK